MAEKSNFQPGPGRGRGPGRQGGGGGGGRRGRPAEGGDKTSGDGKDQNELSEKVVFINRSSKVVKGGRRFSFSALIVVGDKQGNKVGLGLGKAGEVADAIRKGGDFARRQMVSIALRGATIPHDVLASYGGAKVLLRPASPGTGIIAGKTVRAVVESCGVRDVLSKSLGSANAANVAKATLSALLSLRLLNDIFARRGLKAPVKNSSVIPVVATVPPPIASAPASAPTEPAPISA